MLSIVENIIRFFLNVLIFSIPIVFTYFFINQILLILKKDKKQENKLLRLRNFWIKTYVAIFFILIILLILLGYIG